MFIGPKGEIEIEKKDKRWKLHGDPAVLELHGLDRSFDEESVFRDAVSCYLLGFACSGRTHARQNANGHGHDQPES